jgi:hypothetical protein
LLLDMLIVQRRWEMIFDAAIMRAMAGKMGKATGARVRDIHQPR